MGDEGKPLHGDRGAFDTIDNAIEHAKGIALGTLKHHLAAPGVAGEVMVDDGTNWVKTNVSHDDLLNTHNLTTDIDHATITNTHNLTTDINHATITNTHNLTTDIDHDQLTNFAAGEHFTMLDEDDMASDSNTQAATQQSIKAYADALPGGAHDILHATHSDTLVAAVSEGSLVIGNATPKWSELVHPGDSYHYLHSIGTGVAWSTGQIKIDAGKMPYFKQNLIFDGSDGVTITFPAIGTVALLGTANVFTAIQKINVNNVLALLVEQDGVKDNVLVVDTTNGSVGVGTTPLAAYTFQARVGANQRFSLRSLGGKVSVEAINDVGDAYVPLRISGSTISLEQGSVGINTVLPETKLDVVAAVNYRTIHLNYSKSDNTDQRTGIVSQSYDADIPAFGLVGGYSVSGFNNAVVLGYGDGAVVDPANRIIFYTTTDFGASNERMRIDPNGYVGILTSTPSWRLDVYDNRSTAMVAAFRNNGNHSDRYGISVWCGDDAGSTCYNYTLADGNGTTHGGIAILSQTVQIFQSSDLKRKKNVRDTMFDRSKFGAIKIRDFEWKANGATQTGMVAQELLELYPESVIEHEGELAILPMMMIPKLVMAVQDLQKDVDILKEVTQ